MKIMASTPTSNKTKTKHNTNCCVYGCHSRKMVDRSIHFHSFPEANSGIYVKIVNAFGDEEEIDKRRAWEKVLLMGEIHRRPVTKCMRVCSKHFQKKDYCAEGVKMKQPKLKRFAVPSQNLPKEKYHSDGDPQEVPSSLRQQNLSKRPTMALTPPPFPPEFDVWDFALKHFPKTPKYDKIITPYKNLTAKQRSSTGFIKHCLSIYLSCPEIYNVSQKHFKFADKSYFPKVTKNISLGPGINEETLDLLKMKFDSLTKNDKHCMVCIQEVKLKPQLYYNINKDLIFGFEDDGKKKIFVPATRAYVIFANGLYTRLRKPWRQPITYFFSHERLSAPEIALKLLETINTLQSIGLSVDAIVSSDTKMAKILNISPEKHYVSVNKHRIYFFFDTGRLMVRSRNVLKKYKIVYNNERPVWKDIEDLVKRRPKTEYSLNNLDRRHVELKTVQDRRNIKLATETLTHMVAAEIEIVLDQPKDQLHTAEFIARMDKMYNIFNSPIKSKSDPRYFQPYKANKVQHFMFRNLLKLLKELKVYDNNVDVTKKIRVFECWNVNINSLELLWNFLKHKGHKNLFTSWINLNYVRQFLKKSRKGKIFTVNTFSKAFHKEFTKCLVYASDKTLKDQDKRAGDLIEEVNVEQFISSEKFKKIKIRDTDYRHHNLETLTYKVIRSYLLKQCRDLHYCRVCGGFSEDNSEFVEYIYKLDSLFEENFGKIGLKPDCLKTYIAMCEYFESHPCPTFPKRYLVNLFARMKMYYCLKTANNNFKQSVQYVDFSFGMMPAF